MTLLSQIGHGLVRLSAVRSPRVAGGFFPTLGGRIVCSRGRRARRRLPRDGARYAQSHGAVARRDLEALEQVIDPELRRPVTELDMVREIGIDGGDVDVTIALTVAGCPLARASRIRSRQHVGAVAGRRARAGSTST